MNQAIIARIENALHVQLNSAIEDIVMSVMEEQLECHDFDTQYEAYTNAQCDYAADIGELAENISEVIRAEMEKRIEALEVEMGERYEDEVLPAVKATHELDGQIDGPARRDSWCNFIDDLNKSGELTEYQTANIDFDVESL